MSEWLRRQTRNLLGFACAGSNPAVDVFLFFVWTLDNFFRPIFPIVYPDLWSVFILVRTSIYGW
jgi:hypothetical protein